MNQLFSIIVLLLVLSSQSGFAQSTGKKDYQKNSVQIGKTGYYFDKQNPFGFGSFIPYIGYTRKITRAFSFKTSIEYYYGCYRCMWTAQDTPFPVFDIEYRQFKLLQLNALYEFPIDKKLSLILAGGGGYRWEASGEGWIEVYSDHGGWSEILGNEKSFYEWGVGGALEVKYKFYKGFSLSVKGEYFSFPARPVRHLGAGAYVGYDF